MIFLKNQKDLEGLAESLARSLSSQKVILLNGPMGAGKTTFTRNLIQSLSLEEKPQISSPTYALIKEYQLNHIKLVHADLYRLAAEDLEILELLENHIDSPNSLVIVEWSDKIPNLKQKKALIIDLEFDPITDQRSIKFSSIC